MYLGYVSPIFIRARSALPRPPLGTPLRGADSFSGKKKGHAPKSVPLFEQAYMTADGGGGSSAAPAFFSGTLIR
jgi:hypothetical protein